MPDRYDSEDVINKHVTFAQSYPNDFFDKILSYHDLHHDGRSLVLDVACGSGLSTTGFAPHFDRVIGLDASVLQLETADKRFDNVSYREGVAENLSFQPDNSVDLLLIASAMHLVDMQKFYKEVVRVLKPGGTFVVCCYALPYVPPAQATAIMDEVNSFEDSTNLSCFYKRLTSRTYTKRQQELLHESFKDEILPFPGQIREEVRVKREWPLSNVMGFISMVSCYQDLMKANPASTELSDLQAKLCSIINKENPSDPSEDPVVEIEWYYFALLASKPRQ